MTFILLKYSKYTAQWFKTETIKNGKWTDKNWLLIVILFDKIQNVKKTNAVVYLSQMDWY